MAQYPNRICCSYLAPHYAAMDALKQFDVWWTDSQVPECTLVNVLYLSVVINSLERAFKRLSKARDDLMANGDTEELAKHTPEYEAFVMRYENIKAIQKMPEWDKGTYKGQVEPNEWKAARYQVDHLLQENYRATDMFPGMSALEVYKKLSSDESLHPV